MQPSNEVGQRFPCQGEQTQIVSILTCLDEVGWTRASTSNWAALDLCLKKTIKRMIKSTSEDILHCSITTITCSGEAPACLLFLCKIKPSCIGLTLAPVCYIAKYLLHDRLSPFRYMKLSVSSLRVKHILLLVIAITEHSPVKKPPAKSRIQSCIRGTTRL